MKPGLVLNVHTFGVPPLIPSKETVAVSVLAASNTKLKMYTSNTSLAAEAMVKLGLMAGPSAVCIWLSNICSLGSSGIYPSLQLVECLSQIVPELLSRTSGGLIHAAWTLI